MSEIKLPKIGLGTMGGRNKNDVEAYSEAIKMGYRFIDTAQIYYNEKAVGLAIKKSKIPRDLLIIASKVFIMNYTYDRVIKSTEKSLKKLGLDRIDIMYIHWPSKGYQKRKTEVLKAFSELADKGKIGYLGISNFTVKHTSEVLEIYDKSIITNQVEMHPWLKQEKLLEYLNKKGIKLVSYFPLMHGRINQVPELSEIAKKHDVSTAQVSLAWIMSKGAIPIPKSTNIIHLKDNFTSINLTLDTEDIQKIDSIEFEKRFGDFPMIAPKWD